MNWNLWFLHLAEAVLPFAVAALTWAISQGARYATQAVNRIRNRTLREGLDWAIAEASQVAETVVVALNQTVVNAAKAAGTWNPTVAAKVKQQAMDIIVATLSSQAQSILRQALPDLTQWLSALVEKSVALAPNRYVPTAG